MFALQASDIVGGRQNVWKASDTYSFGCGILSRRVHTTPEEFENGAFTLNKQQMFFVHTRKQIKCFPSTLSRRNLKTQQSHATETFESTREHAHSKVLVEPTWRNQHGNPHFGRHFGFVFEEVSSRQIT